MISKLIILDRDGVINRESSKYIKTPDEWEAIPGSLNAIALLNQKGFSVAIATNQSGISRGYFSLQTLSAIHKKLLTKLGLVGGTIKIIAVCPHKPDEHCCYRKPKPGMLLEILKKYKLDPLKIYIPFVGDTLRDLQAAEAAHCVPILVKTGYGIETLKKLAYPLLQKHILVFDDLLSFAKTQV